MAYELKEYTFGQTIGKGFNLFFNNFLLIAGVSLVISLPGYFFGFYEPRVEDDLVLDDRGMVGGVQ